MSNNFNLVKHILDTDESEKIRTTVENFQLVEMPDEIVEFVTAKLLSKDNGIKDTITKVLISNKNKNIPKYLVPYISSEDLAARNLAGEILLKRKNESIEAMLNYLPKANDDDKKFIIDILGLIGDPQPAKEIIGILKFSNDDNVILACVEALGNLKTDIGFNEMIAVYKQNELFRPTVIEALGKIGTNESISFINKNYYGADELTKYSLIESLGNIGNKESFEMLINDVQYLKGAFKWVAIETIGKLQEKLNLTFPQNIDLKNSLIETLETADIQYKKASVRLVCLFNNEELLEKVLNIYGIDEEIDQKLYKYFSNNKISFFKKVSQYLKQKPQNINQIIKLMIEMIQLDSGESLQLLDELELRTIVEQLTSQLTNSDEEIRSISMELLFFLDAETALIFSDIMVEDAVSWNRLKLLEIIKNGEHPQITTILKTLSNDEDEMVRENAQVILNERGISNLQVKEH